MLHSLHVWMPVSSLLWLAPHTSSAKPSLRATPYPWHPLEHTQVLLSSHSSLVGPIWPLVTFSKSGSVPTASSLLSSLGVSLFPKAWAGWFELFHLFPRSSRQLAAATGCCSGWPKSHRKRKISKHSKRQSQMCPPGPASSWRRAHSLPREVVLDSWSNGWSKRKRKSQWPSGFRASNAGLSETKVTVAALNTVADNRFLYYVCMDLLWGEVAQC